MRIVSRPRNKLEHGHNHHASQHFMYDIWLYDQHEIVVLLCDYVGRPRPQGHTPSLQSCFAITSAAQDPKAMVNKCVDCKQTWGAVDYQTPEGEHDAGPLIVRPCKKGASECYGCYPCRRFSFNNIAQQELQAKREEHDAVEGAWQQQRAKNVNHRVSCPNSMRRHERQDIT